MTSDDTVRSDTPSGPVSGGVRSDDSRRVAVVTTTIHVPHFLRDLLANADRYGHLDQLQVIVVGDRKTPPEVGSFLADLDRNHPAEMTYLDVPQQKALLRRWPSLDLFVRYDCIQRRNVGYLQAALNDAEVIITVDDDNHMTADDWIGHHLIVGRTEELPVVSHPSGWWNVCDRLGTEPPRRFYHRGYPRSMQDWSSGDEQVEIRKVPVVASGGFWLKTPDVDATTHGEQPFDVIGLIEIQGSRACALAPGTWCPLNSQNTAFAASVLPALYLPVMHDFVRGYRIARMDDIWMSYFLRAVCDRRGEVVAYGPPLVEQQRNPHHVVKDLSEELAGYLLTEWIVTTLRQFESSAETCLEAYLDLIYHLREAIEADDSLRTADREYLRQLVLGMACWHGAVSEIL